MRFLFLILSIVLSFPVGAQEWKSGYSELETSFGAGNYAEVVNSGPETLSQIESAVGKDTSYANILQYIGYANFLLGDYSSAISYGERERSLRAELNGRDNESYGYITFLLSIYKTYVGKWDEAADLAKEALDLEAKLYGKESFDYVNMAMQYTTMISQTNRVEEGRDAYMELLDIAEELYDESDSTYSSILNAAGTFFYTHGMFEEAEPIYLHGLKVTLEYYGEGSDEYLQTLSGVGEFYITAGWSEKAEDIFRQSLEVAEKSKGNPSLDYSTGLNNIGVALEQQGRYQEAIDLYEESLKMKEDLGFTNISLYASNLANLGVIYDNLGQYEKAKTLQQKALDVYKSIGQSESINYASTLSNLGSVYISLADYDKAIEVLHESLQLFEQLSGNFSPGYINALNNLAIAHSDLGRYDQAIKAYRKVITLRKAVQGKIHTTVATSMVNLAHVLDLKGEDADEVRQLLERALEIHEITVGKSHPSYANALNSLANHYVGSGEYSLAERYYQKAISTIDKIHGKNHPSYATQLNNLGYLYIEAGQYELAISHLKDAIALQEELFSANHPSNIYSLSNLANVYIKSGEYASAEKLIKRARSIARENYGVNHADYAAQTNTLATLYYELGNYDPAVRLYREAIDIYEKIYGKDHREYATGISNLGSVYLAMASFTDDPDQQWEYCNEGLHLFEEALQIDSLTLPAGHPDFAYRLNNIAEAHRLLGNWEKATDLYEKSLDIEEKIFGRNAINSASTYHNLALVHLWTREFQEAKEYALKSLEIYQAIYGEGHTQSLSALMNTGYAFEQTGDYKKAEDYYRKGLETNYDYLSANFSFMSESERKALLGVNENFARMFLGFAVKRFDGNPAIAGDAYNSLLLGKGLLLRSTNQLKKDVRASNNPVLIKKFEEWRKVLSTLAENAALPVDQREHSLDSLSEVANELEKYMVRSMHSGELVGVENNWQAIQKELGNNEVAIEFFEYDHVAEDNYPHVLYGAIILKPSGTPIIMDLIDAADLKSFMEISGGSDRSKAEQIYGSNRGSKLYSLLWEPLERELSGIRKVYYSPIGMLHKLSFAAIPMGDSVLAQHYDLVRLSTTGEILNRAEELDLERLMVLGGAEYSTTSSTDEVWTYLDGTKEEAEAIAEISVSISADVQLLLAKSASEEAVKELAGNADIVHISTHGFFYPDPRSIEASIETEVEESLDFRGSGKGVMTFVNNPDPMMRSGLVLSGANDVWSRSDFKGEDGVLTALEVSNMELINTRLAVLSACETGLGDVEGAEGVYGLQRAFKLAGVEQLVMSLWKVPDTETVEFMRLFYEGIFAGQSIEEAFRSAQRRMASKYEPYYWAAFILVR